MKRFMKKIFLIFIALTLFMSMDAQVIKVYKGDVLVATYNANEADRVVFKKSTFTNGSFSVNANKKVQFSKGNLYWNGSEFRFENKQTSYPTSWDVNHVGHFYWTNYTDYMSGNALYMPYAPTYAYSNCTTKDVFFCSEDTPLTVEGESGLFALTIKEWEYIFYNRDNAAKLYKYGVTVDGHQNCLIIAPDGFAGTLKSSYSLEELDNLDIVCLPAAGWRGGIELGNAEIRGYYCSATPNSVSPDNTSYLLFRGDIVKKITCDRFDGHCLRLVRITQ